jgi:hypothetical protein
LIPYVSQLTKHPTLVLFADKEEPYNDKQDPKSVYISQDLVSDQKINSMITQERTKVLSP